MDTRQTVEAPVHVRGHGQVSHLLLAGGDFGSRHLAITWVECEPGSQQDLHAHPESEQAYVIVAGHSMEPTLHTGDLVVARRQGTYRRGDVIAYRITKNQAGAGTLVVHRIVGGSSRVGYMTRGDNRRYRDPWRPKPADIAGKMSFHARRLGLIPVFSHTTLGMALIAALAGFLVLCGGAGTRGRTRKR